MRRAIILIFALVPLFLAAFSATDDVGLYIAQPGQVDQPLVMLNPDKPFAFASNIKLITSAAALHYLGGSYCLTTNYYFDPTDSSLYVMGNGDFSTDMGDLWDVSRQLRLRGVTTVKNVYFDDYLFGPEGFYNPPGSTENGDAYYLCYASPLMLDYNSIEISIMPGKLRQPALVTSKCPNNAIRIDNRCTTAKGMVRQVSVSTSGGDGYTIITVRGKIGAGVTKPVIFNKKTWTPGSVYAASLAAMLDPDCKAIPQRARLRDRGWSGCVTYTRKSSPLREILRPVNVWSINQAAESMAFFLGAEMTGNPANAAQVLNNFCHEELGMEADLANGCGLGHYKNKLTPRLFGRLLEWAWNDPMVRIDFFGLLPEGGEEGTLRRAPDMGIGAFRAKTGTLNATSALTGIVYTNSGKPLLFSLAVNNYGGRKLGLGAYRWFLISQACRVLNEL